jgi:two-component sensor histidine kinase
VTNAFKHAFPPGVKDAGRVRVGLRQMERTIRLDVADDGVGIAAEGRRESAVGLELVSLWATHQLGGRLTVRTDPGTAFTVEFDAG